MKDDLGLYMEDQIVLKHDLENTTKAIFFGFNKKKDSDHLVLTVLEGFPPG